MGAQLETLFLKFAEAYDEETQLFDAEVRQSYRIQLAEDIFSEVCFVRAPSPLFVNASALALSPPGMDSARHRCAMLLGSSRKHPLPTRQSVPSP